MHNRLQKRLIALVLAAVATLPALAQQLTVAHGVDIPGFDPHTHSNTAVESVHINVFDYLVMRDASGQFQPALAVSWEQQDDTVWHFSLRDDVTWHDGTPFTAADVEFTLERVAGDSALVQHQNYHGIVDVEVLSDFELLIHTSQADPILLNRLSRITAGMLPKHYIDEVGFEHFAANPLGTGPFEFVEWRRDDRIILQANEDHWRGAPAWEALVFRVIPEDSTRVNELITGGVDIAVNIPAHEVERVDATGEAVVLPWPTGRVMMFFVNTEDGLPTADPRVREALDLAIDNALLAEVLTAGAGVPVRGYLTPNDSAVPLDLYDTYVYDPVRARELIAEAGYAPGELTITIQGPAGRYPMDVELVELVAAMLAESGISAKVESTEFSVFNSQVWEAQNLAGIALMGLSNSMQDGWFAARLLLCEGPYANVTNWCNPEFDALVNEAEYLMDSERRAELLGEAFHIIAEERPQIFLYQLSNFVGVASDVDWQPRSDELLWMLDATPRD